MVTEVFSFMSSGFELWIKNIMNNFKIIKMTS